MEVHSKLTVCSTHGLRCRLHSRAASRLTSQTLCQASKHRSVAVGLSSLVSNERLSQPPDAGTSKTVKTAQKYQFVGRGATDF
jgi:hypothetical protein